MWNFFTKNLLSKNQFQRFLYFLFFKWSPLFGRVLTDKCIRTFHFIPVRMFLIVPRGVVFVVVICSTWNVLERRFFHMEHFLFFCRNSFVPQILSLVLSRSFCWDFTLSSFDSVVIRPCLLSFFIALTALSWHSF